MANTSFDEIHNFSLIIIRDYVLDSLYDDSPTNFNTLMDNFLLRSIPLFTNCQQDLTDYNTTTRTFNIELSLQEQMILSDLEILTWLDSQILDIKQFSLILNNTDFKTYSSAKNLTAKLNLRAVLWERVNHNMSLYSIATAPWEDWKNGVFE